MILICLEAMISTTDTARNNIATTDCSEELMIIFESAVLTGSNEMYNSNNSELYLKPALSANTPFRPAAEILYSPVAELVLKNLLSPQN